MKLVQVYDPPMCCTTGACGPDVDPVLPRFAGLLAQLGGAGLVYHVRPECSASFDGILTSDGKSQDPTPFSVPAKNGGASR